MPHLVGEMRVWRHALSWPLHTDLLSNHDMTVWDVNSIRHQSNHAFESPLLPMLHQTLTQQGSCPPDQMSHRIVGCTPLEPQTNADKITTHVHNDQHMQCATSR